MASEAMSHVNEKLRLKYAQRAVHIHPTCKEARAALLACSA